MKIICIKGGLGNQMFEFCRYMTLKERNINESIHLFYDRRRLKEHGGVQLSECFNISLPSQKIRVVLTVGILKLCRAIGVLDKWHNDEKESAILIDDFSQDKCYIHNAAKWFTFRKEVREISYYWEQKIQSQAFPVAIHYRRGDYLHPNNINTFGICSQEYYRKAQAHILRQHPEAHFFIFSDDTDWTEKNIKSDNTTIVKLYAGTPDYAAMYLMSCCQGHIIANSTFSFWGATLSQRSIVKICPAKWYAASEWTEPDIFSKEWIRI